MILPVIVQESRILRQFSAVISITADFLVSSIVQMTANVVCRVAIYQSSFCQYFTATTAMKSKAGSHISHSSLLSSKVDASLRCP